MVTAVDYSPDFAAILKRMKDSALKERVKKQIAKLLEMPESGKPMRHARKGTRELYIPPFRLSYAYLKKEEKVVLLDIYHKDKQ